MFLDPYFNQTDTRVQISKAQASAFAKGIAQDFNPIHDVDAKRFCVPGDLLFALVLSHYGLSQKMQFRFEGMVGDGVELQFPAEVGEAFSVRDSRDKSYLQVQRQGEVSHCPEQIESFIRSYVAFSGLNFVHVLVPLMHEHGVMINPDRPLVIYESMAFELNSLDFTQVTLELVKSSLAIDGKRGDVTLEFALMAEGKTVGTGLKTLVMSGLRPLESEQVDAMVAEYESRRQRG
ncbi:DUF3581 domain-containing protein [Shewanella sedimentimangrovi]|uniref:DUF3581 domain-containing protein n=1 Tax=Shewanella sedimentimangrovi TaxID=2814293 RepID=A0ABX7R1R9_9GAMM|nr:DUF3581 domain-containing protein [Shewanella sedimentimangrovi]QSX37756.1 DUF3581 domain-containing protein [Shewanella sedimentimangrovi]